MRPVLRKAAEKDGRRETIKQEPRNHACLDAERWQFGVFRLKVVFPIPEEVEAISERRQKRPKNFKLPCGRARSCYGGTEMRRRIQ